MKATIVAFSGLMGSGKSEAIDTLRKTYENLGHLSRPVILIKFAQPLYDMQEYVYERIKSVYVRPESFIKDRLLLQWLGTEWGRDTIDSDLWVKLWIAAVEQVAKDNPDAIIVCDDCRFNNEAKVIKQLNGIIIKITSDKAAERINTSLAKHSSESGISNNYIDYIVENNLSLEQYKNSLSYLFKKIGL